MLFGRCTWMFFSIILSFSCPICPMGLRGVPISVIFLFSFLAVMVHVFSKCYIILFFFP